MGCVQLLSVRSRFLRRGCPHLQRPGRIPGWGCGGRIRKRGPGTKKTITDQTDGKGELYGRP